LDFEGAIPGQIVENVLYYYTEPFQVVVDPMAGGGTTIDLFWDAPVNHAVFLDGEPVHSGKHQAETDELVTRALRKRGITVARYRYTPPLTKTERKRIADEIEQALKEKEAERQRRSPLHFLP